MKMIRKLFVLFSSIVLLFLIIFTYNRMTDGFSVYQIKSKLKYEPQYEIGALDEEKMATLYKILDQPYHYLGKGCQFYAFESACGKYVIKFPKQKHLRSYTWLRKLCLPEKLREMAELKIQRRERRVQELFSSCKLAYMEMPTESGIYFIHLNKTPLYLNALTIKDKLGFNHKISLDEVEFIVQKKGKLLKEVFFEITEKDVKENISKLSELVICRCQKGICDHDSAFVQNVALSLDGDPIFLDVGQLYKNPIVLTEEEQKKELADRLGHLFHWTEKHYPHLVTIVGQHIQEIISNYIPKQPEELEFRLRQNPGLDRS